MSLFNKKTIARQTAFPPPADARRVGAFTEWAESISSGRVAALKETELHGPFMQTIAIEALGYAGPVGHDSFSVTQEQGIIRGSVDLAFGHFSDTERRIVAPFELKGADTKNLDAMMPGRAKSPVDQAWEYATGNAGTQWVLVSNYLEIRLYAYAEGRQEFEKFDLRRLHEPVEFTRAQLLLSAESLLGGRTAELLAESKRENKDITDRLYADYKVLRSDLIGAVRRERPELDPLIAIRTGQKILDRVLFIAFAEDTGLLPARILERAFETTNAFSPAPVWNNFTGLFKAIDEGSPPLKVPRYNGGLFKPDDTIAALNVPDHICEGFKRLAEYDFASEVSVTVLGHIFEQSIADVEQLQAEARGDAIPEKKASGTSGRRKRDGVVYTPDYIARFIVERTLGTHARELFDRLLGTYAAKGASAADDPIAWKSKAAERSAWEEYRSALTALRIVDPACGSGVFLVMAFDWLKAELGRVNEKLRDLTGAGGLYDPDSEILTNNLFGVDVNEESVEIAKLSLWIKTARHGKVLDSLDKNFRVGDSLIEDSNFAYRSHGFVWKDAFAEVFAEGGFDVVLGNPPYVRAERLKSIKGWLQGRFEVHDSSADLSAYFFERGVRLLKAHGRLGFVSSSTFFQTAAGMNLRNFLRAKTTIESVVDFGDLQIFQGVATLPMIMTLRNALPQESTSILFWSVDQIPEDSFETAFAKHAETFPQSGLSSTSWKLEPTAARSLRAKIIKGGSTLKKVFGGPRYGIKTGANPALVIDEAEKERICAAQPESRKLIQPWLEGRDLGRWRAEPKRRWLILIKKGWTLARYGPAVTDDQLSRLRADFPQLCAKLQENEAVLSARSDKGDYWWEVRACDYYRLFTEPKIIYPEFSRGPEFSIDDKGFYVNNKIFIIGNSDRFLLALLNSKTLWFVLSTLAPQVIGGSREIRKQYVETLPIPPATDVQRAELAALAEAAQAAAEKRYALQQEIIRRIPDLARAGGPAKLTERLKSWWTLPDFAAFQAEVKKAFKTDIPLKERSEWENWIGELRPQVHALSGEIARAEAEINAKVYALFDLTPDEIALLEANI